MPRLAIDHRSHVVDARRGNELASDLRIENGPHECRIAVRVEQVQRPGPPSAWLSCAKSNERFSERFDPSGHHTKTFRGSARRHLYVLPSTMASPYVDVGVLEIGQRLLPVGFLELRKIVRSVAGS